MVHIDQEEVHVAARLRQALQETKHGKLPFHTYMAICLYEPGVGYYEQDRPKIGRDGDFYTSAHLGTVMGEVLARYIKRQWENVNGVLCLVEWGAGSGRLLRQICDALREQAPKLVDRIRWIAVEQSTYHKQIQRQDNSAYPFEQMTPEQAWVQKWPPHTLIYANELIDAFAVHRLRYDEQEGWEEQHVYWQEREQAFASCWQTMAFDQYQWLEQMLSEWKRIGIEPRHGQIIEWNEQATHWMERTARTLSTGGQMLIIDYGDESEELFAAHRMAGTLVCYYRHQAHDRFLENPGEQDMTTHVNFSQLKQAAKRLGLDATCYQTQKQFLLEEGVLELLVEHQALDPFSPGARRNRAIRQLLISDQMSELFKVLILSK